MKNLQSFVIVVIFFSFEMIWNLYQIFHIVIWFVMLCSDVVGYQHFGGP